VQAGLMPVQSSRFAVFLFSYYAFAGTFATYASLFFAERGMSAPQIGILMSLIQVMRIFGPNLWGWVADHTQQRVKVLRLTAVAALMACGGILLGRGFVQLFVAMAILNLFTSAQGPISEALMLSGMKGDLTHYGRIRLWGSLGFIAAVMGAAYGLDWFGVASLPWIAGALMLLVLGAALRIHEEPRLEAAHDAPSLWSVLRQPAVLAFFLQLALMVAAHSALYVYYSLYLERIGYGKPVIGAMWSLGVLAEIVFFYFQAAVFKRVAAHRLMLFAFAVGLVRFAMIGAGAASIAVLVLAQLLHAATFGAHHSSSIMAMQRWFAGPLQARGQALFISIGYGVGGTLGGLFMALCWDRLGAQAVYFAAAALCAAGAGAAALSQRWQAPR
jgi:PPP family 3-phenylpropionic acid transporter